MEALMDMAAPHEKVVRDGRIKDIEAELVVPKDLIVLEAGNRVPRCSCNRSQFTVCHESMLTGRSIPVSKTGIDINETENEIKAVILYMEA